MFMKPYEIKFKKSLIQAVKVYGFELWKNMKSKSIFSIVSMSFQYKNGIFISTRSVATVIK